MLDTFTAAFITPSMNSAAYMSESIRGGIESVDIGQREAAKALGVSYPRMMMDIVIPQAMRAVLPAISNEAVGMLKSTSLVSVIGVSELMRAGR